MAKSKLQSAPRAMLMLDNYYLNDVRNVKRYYHKPVKFSRNPVLHTGQVRWEKIPLIFGSVKFDPFVNRYRMWYIVCKSVKDGMNVHDNACLGLAESSDGINWRRAKIKGKADNCVFGSNKSEIFIETGSVLIDSDAPRNRRYVMVYCAKNRSNEFDRFYRLAFSEDGINWKRGSKIPITSPAVVDRHALLKNPITNEYMFFVRGERPLAKNIRTVDSYERTVCLQKSNDLQQWSRAIEVMTVDKSQRINGLNIYSLCPFYRGESLVGIYQIHDMRKEVETVTTHLCWSYDGLRWHKMKEEFIPLGRIGQWDRFNNAVADTPLIIGDTMYFYYSGRIYRHGGYEPVGVSDSGQYFGGIGIATMKLDRFASLAGSFDVGLLRTKEFLWPNEGKLYLNANCKWGKIEISAKTENAESIAVIEGKDEIAIPVNLKVCKGSAFTLTVKLINAELYAMYWSKNRRSLE